MIGEIKLLCPVCGSLGAAQLWWAVCKILEHCNFAEFVNILLSSGQKSEKLDQPLQDLNRFRDFMVLILSSALEILVKDSEIYCCNGWK